MFTEGEAGPLGSGSGGLLGQGSPPLADALALAERAQTALAAVELDGEDDRAVLDAALQLARVGNQLAGQQLRLLAEVDRREAYQLAGAVTTAAWYRQATGAEHAAAARQVQAATRSRVFPALREALQAGDVSLAHVTAVTDAAVPRRRAALAAADETLTALAVQASPREVRRAVQLIRDQVDADATDTAPLAETGPDERRRLALRRTVDGLWDLTGVLDPLAGEALATLVDAYDTPDPAHLPHNERRSPGQRRADAFDAAVRQMLASGGAPSVGGVKPHIVATVDLADLLGLDGTADGTVPRAGAAALGAADAGAHGDGAADAGARGDANAASRAGDTRPPRLRHGGATTPAVVRRLAYEAKLTAVLTLGPWRVTNVGRTQRTLPPWLRVVLDAVHGHCRGPACDRPLPWAEAHHVVAWADDGETDLNTTIPLCTAHHQLVTAGTWRVSFDPGTGMCAWTGPDNQVIHTRPP